ncbi:hypothetical protein CcaverHIS002_0500740 [Cutaneotrichosporon cavernicola]|uniref:Uncharacterized protein n=1 Tax=Cutaneotrichosporon cavernicola TaxID=279322 RepID=A0AA48QXR4_9TREE|nr:uncharacterized protein CcaverHIS019_0600740 [Cutaneotrichosporon cavernicola]BEI84673.1 hypothetical protein CcaverHIS002_0500740 [Cutaneotrichosporon cavernicola]BEI93615.1 hypothetical protein CcaverHIS019_0600740 [Cutaneotrichosporon cavernicola]BEJ01392.1 hypothetical protein CcaverHIS631_0600740 [Cutaneotrichosporon cavernicola]BEJ09159.1 hypothetical protein CcaverHIS641_0600740 [Cutaneotrichosporon cavernicola]
MPFRAAQGGPMKGRRAGGDLRERQAPAGQGQQGGQTPQASGAQAQQSQAGGQAQGSPQAQQPAAASPSAAANQASVQAGQSPAAAAAGGSSAATPVGQSVAAGAPAAAAASQSGTQNAAQPAGQNGTPGGPTNLPSVAGASGSASSTHTSFSAPHWSTDPGAFISSTVDHGSKGLSQPVIGALVGGIIGGLALIIVSFVIWRQCRGRGEKVAPPPPREVSYRPPTMVGNPPRSMSMTMSSSHRVSSYSTREFLGPRPSGTFRQSYYSAYPVDSPTSSIQQDQSPRFPSNSIPGSPSFTSSGGTTPHRDGSTGSGTSSGTEAPVFQEHDGRPLRRAGNSADQLSPYDNLPPSDGSESRTTGSNSRTSSPPPSIASRLPQRNPSNGSLGSGLRYGGTQRGAPHNRSISITLPRPLSQTSINALDSNPVSPLGTYHPRHGFTSNRTTPRTSMYGEFGAQSIQVSPSGHRRGPSTSSRHSENRPDAAQVDNLRFEGREDIV